MSLRKTIILILCAFSAVFFSCGREETLSYENGKGGLRFSLETEIPATRADVAEGTISPDDFKIEIINSKGVIFKRWNTYADYKAEVQDAFVMNAGGPYKLRATYGDSLASGFDAFFFMGEQEFTVVPQSTVVLKVVCRMANVKVAVAYGDNIKNGYSDYSVTVKNSKGSLVFGKDCAEAGYLPAEDLEVSMTLTDHGGKEWFFTNENRISANAGDFITLNMDTKSLPEYGVGIEIIIDRTTNDHTVVIEIPNYLLPAPAPVVSYTGFDKNGNIAIVEGMHADTKADFKLSAASNGIKSCVMSVVSPLLKAKGWPESIDFLNMTPDVKNIIDRDGLLYSSMAAGNLLANIEFTNLCKILKYNAGDAVKNRHEFTIVLTDSTDKSVKATVSIDVTEADKSVTFTEGNVWAKRLYATLATTNGNPDLLVPQISTDGQSWTVPAYTESVSGNEKSVAISGLDPGTAYQIRAVYNDNSSASVAFTTEVAAQVQNAGFEEWSEWDYVAYSVIGTKKQKTYAPYADEASRWWDTNNSRTTVKSTTPGYLTYKTFPMVTYVEGYGGGKAAQIMAIAINNGNTSGTSLSDAVPGELFVGTYDGDRQREFASRPSKLKFQYKYQPRQTDTWSAYICLYAGTSVIAEGTYEYKASSDIDWTSLEIPLKYSTELRKATAIYIQFRQSTADKPPYQVNANIVYGGTNTAGVHGGSILTIDNMELIYE